MQTQRKKTRIAIKPCPYELAPFERKVVEAFLLVGRNGKAASLLGCSRSAIHIMFARIKKRWGVNTSDEVLEIVIRNGLISVPFI